ncbi:pro-neuregulin-1, membrane-bound isoform-like isoform X5 [Carassius auratus]|uniref:Pro-neuregulin-1, membrane-bound isoform-like isoform X5 n=1 Tax=Carassius auratus TaxID=7957 RepID=A0A6P6KU24_CARAU|nr:pro-neuregulin-1, membrane-bound isoform-like isoform X5 [Carassius auratus]
MKSEAAEDVSARPESQEAPSDDLSEVATKESPEEAEEDVAGGSDSSERAPLGCVPVAACCVCLELERVSNCIRSEKICILPILACLLSLALCTAGLKWVFVDKIFEYEPPTHLDLKRIGQDPIIYSDFTHNTPSTVTPTTVSFPGQSKVFVEGESTAKTFEVHSSKVPVFTPTAAVTVHTNSVSPPSPKSTFKPLQNGTANQYPSQTLESNDIVPVTSATSTTPSTSTSTLTSSHVTRCSESERNYCVNGGECFRLEVPPGNIKRLCRCPNEFTGDRCQNYVMASFYKHLGIEFMEAEELYQKRVLTITGICIALLVVGIMCVVAYCKTKKQRKKLHDRLRQSLRERNAAAKGLQHPHPPPENLQLVDHCMPKNVHVTDKEMETSLSTNEFTSSSHPSTAVTHSSCQCWSNGKAESLVSDSHVVLVKSSVENCQHGASGQRGRLNGTGGVHQLNNQLMSSRETQGSPYSERYVSAMTTPSRLSPVGFLSPVTPSSPPSEMSAPLSSLATSFPSMAMSPSGEEEHPLLFLRDKSGLNQGQKSGHNLRNSAHYNHGLELPSPPTSPLHIVEHEEYESAQQYQSTAAASAPSSPPHSPTVGPCSSRTQPSGQMGPAAVLEPVSGSNSESSSSESETEDAPFLGLQHPLATGSVVLDALEGSRTNPALLLSPKHDLQSRLTAVMVIQDPIAV